MDIKHRIYSLCKELGLSVRQFEIKCGLSNGYIGNIVNTITVPKLEKIMTAYPNVNRNWLVYGEGSMFREDNGQVNDDSANYVNTESGARHDDSSMMAIIVSQQNTIERLTKIIDNMMSK